MIERSISKTSSPHGVDKKDLINLDLYKNEIEIMHQHLDKVKAKPLSEEVKEKIGQLKHALKTQKNSLDRFYQNYDINEINIDQKQDQKFKPEVSENFFQHLRSFENNFKDTRDDVNLFLSDYF